MSDMKVKLSTLWIVVMFNIVFADILSFISPGFPRSDDGICGGNSNHERFAAGIRNTLRDSDCDDSPVSSRAPRCRHLALVEMGDVALIG